MVENIECALSRTRDTAVNGIHENRFTNLSLEVSSDGMDFTKGTIGFPSETYRYRQSIKCVMYIRVIQKGMCITGSPLNRLFAPITNF